jgi:predicted phage tail protein
MIRTVHLHGRLGKKYGRTHRFDISTPAEAIRALTANYPSFTKEILDLGQKGYAYRIIHGVKSNIGLNSADELLSPASGDIRIIPEIIGAKRGGLGQLILGVALVMLAPYAAGALFANTAMVGLATGVATFLPQIGMALALGGIVQMLSPVPKSTQASESKLDPSYIFNGAINTMAQGHPVPVGYGEMIVGSAVISAGIDIDEVAVDAIQKGPKWTNPATGEIEFYPPPTLVWDANLGDWTLPDGRALLFDVEYRETGTFWEDRQIIQFKTNFRTEDGRLPTLSTSPPRWDIPNPTVFATPKNNGGDNWTWMIRNGAVPVDLVGDRFEVARYSSDFGSGDGDGGSGGDGPGSDSGPGGSSGDGDGGPGGPGGY